MKALNIFTFAAAATMFFACNDSVVTNPVEPKPGQDVEFTVNYNDAKSRTAYGDEVNDGTGHYFPVNWVSTDQVFVMSNECSPSTAQYKVGFENGQQPSAESLVKMGDAGLQWSEALTGNFYSIYPYAKADRSNANPSGRAVTVRMPHIQTNQITIASDNKLTAEPDMDAAFLYAHTNGVQNGDVVKLHYYNLATALRFTLQGPANGQDGVMIQEVALVAPEGKQIAGNFNLTFADDANANANANGVVATVPTFTPGTADNENLYDNIIIYSRYKESGANLVLNTDQTVELNAFFMINNETDLSNWTIRVKTLDKQYSLTVAKAAAGKSLTLKPGQIHRLGTLPALSTENVSDWETENWMTNIPRNTYISEISVPGSWNSLNKDFQETTSIAEQYNVGVRAFHLDTRWRNASNPRQYWYEGWPTSLPTLKDLAIADGSTAYPVHSGSTALSPVVGRVMNASAPTFQEKLQEICSHVKSNEYMIVMVTFAQGSYNNSEQSWYDAVSAACDNIGVIFDAKNLTPQTTVSNVLGSVIVIVNMEGDVTGFTLPSNSKCLFVNAPLTHDTEDKISLGNYYKGTLYSSTSSTGITLYNTQAQVSSGNTGNLETSTRGWAPTLDNRKSSGKSILDWSLANYANKDDYTTDNWLYLGLGGYLATESAGNAISGSYATVASSMNGWINDIVNNMSPTPTGEQTSYFPIGIVLMNYVTNTTYGAPVVKNILLLNNRYGLMYDPNQPAWPATSALTEESFSASHASGGDAWTVQ